MAIDYKRAVGELQEELTYVRDEIGSLPEARLVSRYRGIIAALEWVLGREPITPASRRLSPNPPWREQHREELWAGEIETGVRPMPEGMDRHYAGGVVGALHWSSGYTEDPPS